MPAPPGPEALARGPAPVLGTGEPEAIAGRYIVVFRKGSTDADVARGIGKAEARRGLVARRYRRALKGFAARLPADALEAVRADPDVAFVEADAVVRATDTQTNAPWPLDRIDQRNLPLNGSYFYAATGAGVEAYVIDSGIRTTHAQFSAGRATSGFDSVDGLPANDCNGHGTHVAGSLGGSTYGVAKAVSLTAVRVLNCQGSGTTAGVIAGVDWVSGDHQAGQPAVANMSLNGPSSQALDNAVTNLIADGVTAVIAAGNENTNACHSSPSRVVAGLIAGSTTTSDARSSFSNTGPCLDLFAPGSSVTSAWHTSDTATNTISGTSMAAPHVAGVAALYLQNTPSASPSTVQAVIVNAATTGVVSDPGPGSPNRLLYSDTSSGPPPPPPCALAETYSGSLAGAGDYDYQPNGRIFFTPNSGIHRGCLRGPASADFDLYLWKFNSSLNRWQIVASGAAPNSTEDVAYSGTPGHFFWFVLSDAGAGSYTFGMTRP